MTEPCSDRGPSRIDRHGRITPSRPRRLRNRHIHTRSDRDRHEPVTHRLGPPTDHPQPTADRRSRDTQSLPDHSVPSPSRLGHYRRPDQIRQIGPAQQQRHRQQHMRHRTPAAPRPARPQRLDQPHHRSRTGETPRRQHPIRARRTRQLTSSQPGLDANGIDLYRDHQCLPHYARCPRRSPPRNQRGHRAPISSSTH